MASENHNNPNTARRVVAAAMAFGLIIVLPSRSTAAQSAAPPVAESQSRSDLPAVLLKGRVTDSTGLPLAGAQVTVHTGRDASSTATAITDAQGDFTIAIEAGTRTIKVTAAGFDTLSVPLDPARIGGDRRNFTLQVAGLRESVSVTAPSGYSIDSITSATRTSTPLRDVPQSVSVVTRQLIADQMMNSIADVVRYVPGIAAHQGENNRDDVVIRGNRSSADFFVNGVRDDVQYYRDLYNLDRVEALKGPNAMIFGRGGGGGVVNRVSKEAGFAPLRGATLQAGAFDNRRLSADVNQPLTSTVAFRVNGMFEDSGSFREGVDLQRGAVNPTATYAPSARTKITAGYEYLRDVRVADRGITSFQGRPADVDNSTFYGNPRDSHVRAQVNLASVFIEHRFGGATVRNRTLLGRYNRFYQNYVPGAATADATRVALTAYNNATDRTNVFNQTDVTWTASTGRLRHTLLTGAEAGRQVTDNFRNTGFFNNTATSILVPFTEPTTTTPVSFRQSATDANNHVRATVVAAFVQDQIDVSRHLQLLGGLRFDRFDLQYHNNRDGSGLGRTDNLVSPRAGIVVKPASPVSIYGSYGVSYLPGSGDQFSSLTVITQQLKPERFINYEIGMKWDLLRSLSMTTAVYRVDRTNTRATDPNDPTRIVQTGSQRTNGYEIGANGQVTANWRVAGGYAWQDAFVTSATAAARAGARTGQVPHHTLSLWNNYQFSPRFGAGLGIVHRSDMFVAVDNAVTLPSYTEADAAAFFTLRKGLRIQANVENLFDARYYINADSNTNISPGRPRGLRIGLLFAF